MNESIQFDPTIPRWLMDPVRDDIWTVLFFVWRWKDTRGEFASRHSYWILQQELAIFRNNRISTREDILSSKLIFQELTYPRVSAKTQHLLLCFCIWIERWLNSYGDTRRDWDLCLYGDIYEQFDEIEQLLTPADNVKEWPNMLTEQL
jgi:hypothetical protein